MSATANEWNFMLALEAFTRSISNLSQAWEQADHTGAQFIDGYPFPDSLDDTMRKVINWRDIQVETFLRENPSKAKELRFNDGQKTTSAR